MAGFKATQVEGLDYDLRPYVDAHGTVPEPSDDLVEAFYYGLANVLKEALGEERLEGVNIRNADELAPLMADLSREDYKATRVTLLDLYANLCDGRPSRDELEALPYRVRQAFYGAVQEWLRPEA